jgi:hypothetical protein
MAVGGNLGWRSSSIGSRRLSLQLASSQRAAARLAYAGLLSALARRRSYLGSGGESGAHQHQLAGASLPLALACMAYQRSVSAMAAGFSGCAWQHHKRPARRHPRRMSGKAQWRRSGYPSAGVMASANNARIWPGDGRKMAGLQLSGASAKARGVVAAGNVGEMAYGKSKISKLAAIKAVSKSSGVISA